MAFTPKDWLSFSAKGGILAFLMGAAAWAIKVMIGGQG